MTRLDDDPGSVCGETLDHDEVITYQGLDGVGWWCRRCDAEGFEESEASDDQTGHRRQHALE